MRIPAPGLLVLPVAVALMLSIGWQKPGPPPAAAQPPAWRQAVTERLPLYGHRNWIVIADAAYPAQSSPGIETVVSGADHLQVLQVVLKALERTKHLRPSVFTDYELRSVAEKDAPGITGFRDRLARVLGPRPTNVLPHERIIARLDEAGKTFRVLIIKTNLTMPYTSVFLNLDCGYWSADAERRLRGGK